MTPTTFLWHDYETFGTDARKDRPAQFAAIRTDADLNPIGEPINILCQPAPDYLPDPGSCLITGITPQQCLENGLPEWQFARRIHDELSQPGTIGVGYNTIRFDDEFTRFLFWRNLIDPYGREWQNGCSRWDLLDVVRMTWALRPQGIQWPEVDGKPSFRLEKLSAANGLEHAAAHDALSDVRATIALARLLRERQPRLFDFALRLRSKHAVAEELGLPATQQQARPFLHISGMIPTEYGCTALMWPLCNHPGNRNEILAWDLRHDPSELATLDADSIRLRLFSRSDALPEGMQRLPISSIQLNRSPMVVRNWGTLPDERAALWQIDKERSRQHAIIARDLPDMSAIWEQVLQRPASSEAVDVDADLYGGFLGDGDRRKLEQLRTLSPTQLAQDRTRFQDERLAELVFRYRARNHPDSLTPEEQEQWQQHCAARLLDGQDGARSIDQLLAELDQLQEQALDTRSESILMALHDYAEQIASFD